MNLCSNDHEEVCYEGRTCPVCDIKKELQSEIDDLQKANGVLSNDVNELEDRLSEIEEVVDTVHCSKWIVKKAVDKLLGDKK